MKKEQKFMTLFIKLVWQIRVSKHQASASDLEISDNYKEVKLLNIYSAERVLLVQIRVIYYYNTLMTK